MNIFPSSSLFNKSYPEFYGDHISFQPFCQKMLQEQLNSLAIWTSSGNDEDRQIKTNKFPQFFKSKFSVDLLVPAHSIFRKNSYFLH